MYETFTGIPFHCRRPVIHHFPTIQLLGGTDIRKYTFIIRIGIYRFFRHLMCPDGFLYHVATPFKVEETINSGSIICMTIPSRMCATKFFPIKLTIAHTLRHFFRQIDRGNIIMIGYTFMIHNNLGLYTLVQQRYEWIVNKVKHDNIHFRTDSTGMTNNTLHTARLPDIIESVCIIIYRCLNK